MENRIDTKELGITELKNQGYKLGKLKDLYFQSELTEQEKLYANKFQKKALISTSLFMVILLSTVVFSIAIAIMPTSNFDPPIMRIFLPVFFSVISIPTIIILLIRACGPKKVAYVVINSKHSRVSRGGKSSVMKYFVSCYQTSPNKVHVSNIEMYKSEYDYLNPGDKAIVIKTPFGATVFRRAT